GEVLVPYDQNEIGCLDGNPTPERVRFGIVPVCDSCRRKRETGAVRIGERNREQAKSAAIRLGSLEGPEFLTNNPDRFVSARKASDQEHCWKGGRASRRRDCLDDGAVFRQSHV